MKNSLAVIVALAGMILLGTAMLSGLSYRPGLLALLLASAITIMGHPRLHGFSFTAWDCVNHHPRLLTRQIAGRLHLR